jgi:hypothetical protein
MGGRFGYIGQRWADVAIGITLEDIRWLCRYLGRIRDSQLRAALAASGANDEAARFTRTIREGISQL